MKRSDPVRGRLQRRALLGRQRIECCARFGSGYFKVRHRDGGHPVKALRVFQQRGIAPLPDVLDNRLGLSIDVAVEQRRGGGQLAKLRLELRGAGVQRKDSHCSTALPIVSINSPSRCWRSL